MAIMDVSEWYSALIGGVIVVLIALYLVFSILKITYFYVWFFFLKHVFYPPIQRNRICRGKTTRFDLLLILGLVGSNILCIAIGIGDRASFVKRTGIISVVNFIPLSLGSQTHYLFDRCGIHLDDYSRVHRWLGRIAGIEAFLHFILAATSGAASTNTTSKFWAYMAISAVITNQLCSLGLFRRHFYEAFTILHRTLVLMTIVATWQHVSSKSLFLPPRIYLFVASCLWGNLFMLRLFRVIFRNLRHGKTCATCTIFQTGRVLEVHVKIPRPWKVRAGQYAYLCIPGISRSAMFQWHPFVIAYWYRQSIENDTLVFVVQPMQGFSRRLAAHATFVKESPPEEKSSEEMRMIIDGPYGNELQLDQYGTILLFATGIGIVGQLPYVKQLLDDQQRSNIKARRVALFWEMHTEAHITWVKSIVNQMLEEDKDYILDFRFYILDKNHDSSEYALGERVRYVPGCIIVKELVPFELSARNGRTIISMCVDDDMNEKIRRSVTTNFAKLVRLVDLEFRPYLPGISRRKREAWRQRHGGIDQKSVAMTRLESVTNEHRVLQAIEQDKRKRF